VGPTYFTPSLFEPSSELGLFSSKFSQKFTKGANKTTGDTAAAANNNNNKNNTIIIIMIIIMSQ